MTDSYETDRQELDKTVSDMFLRGNVSSDGQLIYTGLKMVVLELRALRESLDTLQTSSKYATSNSTNTL